MVWTTTRLAWGCSTDSEGGDRAGFDGIAREAALLVALRIARVRGASERLVLHERLFGGSLGDAAEPAAPDAPPLLDLNSPIRNPGVWSEIAADSPSLNAS